MDDATFKARKAAQAPELMTLVDDVRHWVEEHLETKHPQRANKVYRELELLLDAVRDICAADDDLAQERPRPAILQAQPVCQCNAVSGGPASRQPDYSAEGVTQEI